MRRIPIKFILFCQFVIGITFVPQAQPRELSNGAQISLLTEGPGEELYSGYGHTGIRVRDDLQQLDIVFHYGLFNFDAPGFYVNFLKGKLNYSMGATYFHNFYQSAELEQRTLTEQILRLNQTEKQKLYQLLLDNYKPENRQYWYDFFYDNCATRPRDLFEKAWSGNLKYADVTPSRSFRELLQHHQRYFPWIDLGIDLLHGANTDKIVPVRDEMFLPVFLHDHLAVATVKNAPAIQSEKTLLSFPEQALPSFWQLPGFFFLLLLLIEIYISLLWRNDRRSWWIYIYDRLWFVTISLSSLLMLFMWLGTAHYATKNNWNVLWASPLFWWLSIAKLKHTTSITRTVLKGVFILLVLTLLGWYFIPQSFNIAVLPVLLILTLKTGRYLWIK